jgi:tetratricopeptide (TPR) repeat protein/tRNA A-37 threonylcarbamoyl transferase component Bud32
MERPSPTHVGPYRLLHLLGSGGMGQVFAAVHENMGQQVALKLLSPVAAEDPQMVARFLQEARALAQLDHPGVVRVFHCGRLDDTAFLAMEHLQGLSLRDWMRGHSGPAPLQSALALCQQIADVMLDVHAHGIIHRDLKPENVFLCPDAAVAPGYRVKLLDFGIAKLLPQSGAVLASTQVHTHEASLIGTYAYMAPEQLRNAAAVDGRADVYSLGVLLFELLVGHTPFASDDPVEVISAHLREAAPPLKQFVPALPAALSAFVASMLAKDPEERPAMSRCRDVLGRPWPQAKEDCPVPGLAAFTEAQAELFFGRKAETQALLALLEEARTGGRRWVQLEGAGGVGKSSLIHAGMLPRLSGAHAQGAPRWLIATLRPSERPLRGLALALASALPGVGAGAAPDAVEHALREGPDALRTFVSAHVPEGCLLLLVVEPLEELFTLGASECLMVDALIATALVAPDSALRLLTSLRSDFLHRVEQLPSLARQFPGAARYTLPPMDGAALEQVIQGMAWHSGLQLGEGLAARIVDDARRESARLPLLGHALRELWALSRGALLTPAHYEQLGGVGGSLARQAESLLEGLGAEGRERARRLLLELVRVGRGVPDTRRPRSRQEVLAAAGGDGLAEEVLLRLSGMRTRGGAGGERGPRLVMLSGEEESSRQRVELVHETLFHKVPSLAAWLEEARPWLERHEDLEAAAHAWEDARCPDEGLPTGMLLSHYLAGPDVARGDGPQVRALSSRAARFLLAAERLERQRARRRRGLVMVSLVACLAVVVSILFAWQARQRADEALQQFVDDTEELVGDVDWKLSRHSDTLEFRRRKLQQALSRLPTGARNQPRVRELVIKVQNRLGDIAWHDGTLAEADGFLVEALEELRAGLAEPPEDGHLLLRLALNHSKRGKVALARGDWARARTHFTEALALMERPETQWENAEDRLRTLAVSWSELADLELDQEHWAAADTLYARAIALFEQNSGPYNDALLALALCSRAEVARSMGDVRAAEGYLERALGLARASVQARQDDQFIRWGLTRSLAELGAFQSSQGLSEAAERSYREAQALGLTLRQGESPNKRYALALAQALRGREELARTRGASQEAALLHGELCGLVLGFSNRDGEDIRFKALGCQGTER